MNKRRRYSREFKLAAVKQVVVKGLSFAEVARELDIHGNLIRNWQQKFQSDGTLAAETNGYATPEAEMSRRRQEAVVLRRDRGPISRLEEPKRVLLKPPEKKIRLEYQSSPRT